MRQKKISDYLEKKSDDIMIPSRIKKETLARAQASAKRLGVSLRSFIEGSILMACDQADRQPSAER